MGNKVKRDGKWKFSFAMRRTCCRRKKMILKIAKMCARESRTVDVGIQKMNPKKIQSRFQRKKIQVTLLFRTVRTVRTNRSELKYSIDVILYSTKLRCAAPVSITEQLFCYCTRTVREICSYYSTQLRSLKSVSKRCSCSIVRSCIAFKEESDCWRYHLDWSALRAFVVHRHQCHPW